jgi:hypothetical protein
VEHMRGAVVAAAGKQWVAVVIGRAANRVGVVPQGLVGLGGQVKVVPAVGFASNDRAKALDVRSYCRGAFVGAS